MESATKIIRPVESTVDTQPKASGSSERIFLSAKAWLPQYHPDRGQSSNPISGLRRRASSFPPSNNWIAEKLAMRSAANVSQQVVAAALPHIADLKNAFRDES
jgi:hypothetical protein